MTFDLSLAPGDLSSTLRRAVCNATGTTAYVTGGVGDLVTPSDVRMGKVFLITGLVAVVGAVVYIGVYTAKNANGVPAVLWYNAATGAEAGNGVNFSTWGKFAVEVIGQ